MAQTTHVLSTQRQHVSSIKQPDPQWLNLYLEAGLRDTPAYSVPIPNVGTKLDQNESPYDWPAELKTSIAEKLASMPWNRYPSAYAEDLADRVAHYAGVPKGSVLLAPGSNYLISLLLSLFARRAPGKVVIARPSFALYESHCRYEGIPYLPWDLDHDLEYDLSALPTLPSGSLLIFASPNNPVGNALSSDKLETLLKRHPDSLIIADEAYFEFADTPYTKLLEQYENLILIRTFSKTMGAAGIRLGYIVAAQTYIQHMMKLRLPFLINHFTLAAATEVLQQPKLLESFDRTVNEIKIQRREVFNQLSALSEQTPGLLKIKESQANFLLLRFQTTPLAKEFDRRLVQHGVLIRDVSNGPGLQGCLRMTIGTHAENDLFLRGARAILPTLKI